MRPIFHLSRRVGFVKYSDEFEQLVYVSPRTYVHYFVIHKGFGFSVGVLRQLRAMRVKVLIILYEHDGVIDKLVTDMAYLESNGRRWRDKQSDYQIVLPLNEFNQYLLEEDVINAGS